MNIALYVTEKAVQHAAKSKGDQRHVVIKVIEGEVTGPVTLTLENGMELVARDVNEGTLLAWATHQDSQGTFNKIYEALTNNAGEKFEAEAKASDAPINGSLKQFGALGL